VEVPGFLTWCLCRGGDQKEKRKKDGMQAKKEMRRTEEWKSSLAHLGLR
jgi:hypothetical protein